ncbi:MAG: MFS transporter [Actinobacteria bacterium]|nr:MFS transporter [Actinomycetota bacterium]
MRGILRTYFPPLPRSVTTLQVGGLVNAFGNGITLPFLFIYLHNVRGISLGIVGLIVGLHAVVSIVAGPLFGILIDRLGGRRLLAAALAILAAGYALYPLVDTPWQGFLVAAITGVGVGGFWPSQSTLIAGLTAPAQRPAAFAMQRVVMNLGIGLGALAGGLIATTESPGSFTVLFLLNSLTFVAYGAVMLALVPSPELAGGPTTSAERAGAYRNVLRHRAFVAVIGLNALFIFAGFSGFELLPVYAKNEAAVSETQIGLVFLVNTIVIVLLQLPIARLAQGRRRMPALGLLGLLWAGAWLIVPIAGSETASTATLLFIASMTIFAVGECLHGAVHAPLVSDLADPRLLGRYMALSALSWQVGFALGPAVGGFVLDYSPNAVWFGAAAFCALGGMLAFAVEATLPERARRTPAAVAASA